MLTQLFEWWNFIFFLPLVVGLLLGLLVAFTGLAAAPDLAEAGDADADHSSLPSKALNFFGLGRGVPLMLMLPVLFVVWGISGLLLNRVLGFGGTSWWVLPPALSLSLIITAYAGQGIAYVMGRLFRNGASAMTGQQLVGQVGYAVYEIAAGGGVVHVRDEYGNVHRLVCRLQPDQVAIPASTPIKVVAFSPEMRTYHVEPYKALS